MLSLISFYEILSSANITYLVVRRRTAEELSYTKHTGFSFFASVP